MSPLWLNENGNLIVNKNGNPILCDVCPCAPKPLGIYFINATSGVSAMSMNGQSLTAVGIGGSASALEMDQNAVYVSVGSGPTIIRKVDLSSGTLTNLINLGGTRGNVWELAIDSDYDNRIIWGTERLSSGGTAELAHASSLDGSDVVIIEQTTARVKYIPIFHSTQWKLYFLKAFVNAFGLTSKWELWRCNMDGSGMTMLNGNVPNLGTGAPSINGHFTIDHLTNRLWGPFRTPAVVIGHCSLTGDDLQTVLTTAGTAGDIDPYRRWLYYENAADSNAIYKIKFDGTRNTKLRDSTGFAKLQLRWPYLD